MVPFGRHDTTSVVELGARAAVDSLRQLEHRDAIDAVYVGCVHGGSLVGQRIMRGLGYSGMTITNVENACASSGTALHLAQRAVAEGAIDTALVLGVERLSVFGGGSLPLSSEEIDTRQGVILPALYALRATRYLYETDCTIDDIHDVVVKNRGNGALNPFAHRQSAVTRGEVAAGRLIAEPLRKDDCCPTSDGAAAIVVSHKPVAGSTVGIAASVLQGGIRATADASATLFSTAEQAAKLAYDAAGVGPEDIDIAEVHDAFSVAELLYYEAFGWAKPGEGFALIRDGATRIGGSLPVNPSGGLLARGHPLGASGVAQVVEMWRQLQGVAGDAQCGAPKVAFCQVSGGGISGVDTGTATVHILSA